MDKVYKIIAINPGGTSTKVGYFENEKAVLIKNIPHSAEELAPFKEPNDQKEFRYNVVLNALREENIAVEDCDAYVGRGGSMAACEGGTYFVNEKMLEDFHTSPIKHPANLGAQMAYELANTYGGEAMTVSSPDTDELCDSARFTGIKGVYRESHCHALNQKEVAHRYAESIGKRYEDLNLIVCHVGSGSSIGAHKKGMIVDTSDNMSGAGPICGTRCGDVPVRSILKLITSGTYTTDEIKAFTDRRGGWISLLGTAEALVIKERIAEGDEFARLVYDATIYQTAKVIGSMLAAMGDATDAILFTGGVAKDDYFAKELEKRVGRFAPFVVIAGEFELEALAAGALRHLTGEEPAKIYTGEPYWKGFPE